MALRTIEAHVSTDLRDEALEVLRELGHESWAQEGGRYGVIACAIVGADRTGEALDRLHERLASRGRLLVLVRPLDGVLPRLLASGASDARADPHSAAAVSREEVYASIADKARLDRGYVALVVLATVVA